MTIDKNHPLNVAMWTGFLDWAWRQSDIRQQFEDETGLHYVTPASGGLAMLIDQACGVEKGNQEYIRRFFIWASETFWGEEDETPTALHRMKDADPRQKEFFDGEL